VRVVLDENSFFQDLSLNGTVKSIPVSATTTLEEVTDQLVPKLMRGLDEDQKLSVETECADYELFSRHNHMPSYEKVDGSDLAIDWVTTSAKAQVCTLVFRPWDAPLKPAHDKLVIALPKPQPIKQAPKSARGSRIALTRIDASRSRTDRSKRRSAHGGGGPSSPGRQNRVGAAGSTQERAADVAETRRVSHFGCHILHVSHVDEDGTWQIPPLIHQTISYIENHGLSQEGVFRISASAKELEQAKGEVDSNVPVTLEMSSQPVTLCAALLKQFLRELMEPLCTWGFYEPALAIQRVGSLEEEEQVQIFQHLAHLLPNPNKLILFKLLNLLDKVHGNQDVNMMSASNLSVVIGPSICKRQDANMEAELQDMGDLNKLFATIISHGVRIAKEPSESYYALVKGEYEAQTPDELSVGPEDLVLLRKKENLPSRRASVLRIRTPKAGDGSLSDSKTMDPMIEQVPDGKSYAWNLMTGEKGILALDAITMYMLDSRRVPSTPPLPAPRRDDDDGKKKKEKKKKEKEKLEKEKEGRKALKAQREAEKDGEKERKRVEKERRKKEKDLQRMQQEKEGEQNDQLQLQLSLVTKLTMEIQRLNYLTQGLARELFDASKEIDRLNQERGYMVPYIDMDTTEMLTNEQSKMVETFKMVLKTPEETEEFPAVSVMQVVKKFGNNEEFSDDEVEGSATRSGNGGSAPKLLLPPPASNVSAMDFLTRGSRTNTGPTPRENSKGSPRKGSRGPLPKNTSFPETSETSGGDTEQMSPEAASLMKSGSGSLPSSRAYSPGLAATASDRNGSKGSGGLSALAFLTTGSAHDGKAPPVAKFGRRTTGSSVSNPRPSATGTSPATPPPTVPLPPPAVGPGRGSTQARRVSIPGPTAIPAAGGRRASTAGRTGTVLPPPVSPPLHSPDGKKPNSSPRKPVSPRVIPHPEKASHNLPPPIV